MISSWIFSALGVLSMILNAWQWLAAVRFPLHGPVSDPSFAPPVTCLKPLKGADSETRACLASWLAQQYPGPVQLLFGVARADDPACELVRSLLAEFPQAHAELMVCPESFGPNGKVSTLIQLERKLAHELIVISDADVRVPPNFLQNVVAPFRDEKTGLISCLHSLANPSTLAMRFEAVAINADFWSMALQGKTLRPLDFALGAVMAVRRPALAQIGGFRVLSDYLADDFQLGHRIFAAGWRVDLCPLVAACWESPASWPRVWQHQLRWARTVRVCMPGGYFFSILSNGTLWLALGAFMAPRLWPLWLAALLARTVAGWDLQRRLTRSFSHTPYFWLVPVKDFAGVLLWALSFLGNKIEWKGARFAVLTGGKLQPEN
jgi:ceramide glucosyltransferase